MECFCGEDASQAFRDSLMSRGADGSDNGSNGDKDGSDSGSNGDKECSYEDYFRFVMRP